VKRGDPEYEAKVRAVAAEAPPLTREQADRIRALLDLNSQVKPPAVLD